MRFINRAFVLAAAVLIMAAAGSANAAWNHDGKGRGPVKPHRLTTEAASQSTTQHVTQNATMKPFDPGIGSRNDPWGNVQTAESQRSASTKPFNPGIGAELNDQGTAAANR